MGKRTSHSGKAACDGGPKAWVALHNCCSGGRKSWGRIEMEGAEERTRVEEKDGGERDGSKVVGSGDVTNGF